MKKNLNYSQAIEQFHHQEYGIAAAALEQLLITKKLSGNSFEYCIAYIYLGKCNIEFYRQSKNKMFLEEAKTDFGSASNVLNLLLPRW